jgi:hypothetical protein
LLPALVFTALLLLLFAMDFSRLSPVGWIGRFTDAKCEE